MLPVATLLGIGLLVIAGEAAYGADKPAEDAQGLFEQKCSTCHITSRATSQKKTAREWERTVLRMKNGYGAPVSDAEAGHYRLSGEEPRRVAGADVKLDM